MKRYHLNKREILFWANKARRYLNLPKIDIQVHKVDEVVSDYRCCFDYNKRTIHLLQPLKEFIDKDNKKIDTGSIGYSKDWLIFSIFHEFAHYFQWHYYRKWVYQFMEDNYYKYVIYFDRKIEKNADKIAKILFKRLYKS